MLLSIMIFSIGAFVASLSIAKRYDAELATWFILTAWGSLVIGLTIH